jgi:phospholipid N-methyltransferase
VDAIVSSLPLAIIPDDVVDRIIEASRASLRPGGRFVQYQYTLADYERMTERFPGVTLGFMPLNIPPAFVYGCSLEPTPPAARARSRAASIYAAVLAMATVVIRTVQEL